MGHTVKLMPARYVRPYVKTNKNDAQDAEAICEAVGRPGMRFVPVKTVEQQELSALLTVRALLVRQRTALINQIRGLLGELGIVFPRKAERVLPMLADLLDPENPSLTSFSQEAFQGLRDDLATLIVRIETIDKKMALIAKKHPLAHLRGIPHSTPTFPCSIRCSPGQILPQAFSELPFLSWFRFEVPRPAQSAPSPQ